MGIYSLNKLKGIAIGRETAFGAGGTVSEWIGASEESLQLSIPNENIKELNQRREVKKTYQKARSVEGGVNFDVDIDNGLGVILRSFFGTVTDVSANGTFITAYKHTFEFRQGAEVDSVWISSNKLPGTNVAKNYVGLVPASIGFDFPEDDTIKAQVSFLGQNEATGTVMNGTYGTFQPFTSMGNLQVLIDGVVNSDITNLSIEPNNNAKKIMGVGTNNTISKIVYGEVVCEGSFDIVFVDETERNKFINKTASTLQIKLTGATLSGTAKAELNFKMPKVEYVEAPFEDKDGVIGATIGFKAIYGANAVGTGALICELQNTKASY
jgi:hypothetical protein